MDEWLNKLWYIRTMGYYSEITRNDLLTRATTWMCLKRVMLSEKKKILCYIPHDYIVVRGSGRK